jgi:predicted dehydrogenase
LGALTGRNMVFRAVLAGCGRMAAGWVRAIQDSAEVKGRVEIVGLVDLDPAAAENLKQEFGLSARTGSDLDAMLSATKPDLLFDVVVPAARRGVVLTGLRHGCHVLTEKPMAASLEEARDIIAAARQAGRIHAVVQNRRYVEGVRRIRETIASGVLGELTALHADFFIGAHFGGFRDVMQHVLLLDMAIHTFDAARFMADAEPLAVYALESNPRGSWYAHGAAANAIFEFSSDIVFTYRGSWAAEGAQTSWESAWRVIGTNGTLLWDGADGFAAKVVAAESGFLRPLRDVVVPPVPHPSQTHGHASVLAEFLDAVETGRAPETAGEDNIKSLAMVFGAIESARTHARVGIVTQETSLV